MCVFWMHVDVVFMWMLQCFIRILCIVAMAFKCVSYVFHKYILSVSSTLKSMLQLFNLHVSKVVRRCLYMLQWRR
jgi:hypothetical protein